jgi:hypothetical protein
LGGELVWVVCHAVFLVAMAGRLAGNGGHARPKARGATFF